MARKLISEVLTEAGKIVKRDERIMRYLNVSLDKDANDWAIKRRKKLKKEKV